VKRFARRYNLARLNHILIPTQSAERDRWRNTRFGRMVRPFGLLYEATTLEGQVVSMLAVLVGAASLDVQAFDGHLFWAPLTAIQFCSLVMARMYAMPDVVLEMTLPQRVVAGDNVHFTATLRNNSLREHHAVRIDGPFLTWDGTWTSPRASVAVLSPQTTVTTTLTARFSNRGEHHLDPFRAGALVPFGLAQGPAIRSQGCRFVVVPRIAHVERVETPLGSRHQPGGVARVLNTGESMDLRGVRPYRMGDNIRDLHARSWARTGVPVVREYQQEYFRRVAVVFDTDGRTIDPDIFEASVSLTAGIVAALSREDALVDLLVLGLRAHDLTSSRGSLDATLDLLACVTPDETFDPDAVTSVLSPFVRGLSSVIMVSCQWDPSRTQLLDRIRTSGVGTRAFVVSHENVQANHVTTVSVNAITRNEAMSL
jgi:uncharacterized protein (DUF58 family)